MTGLTPKKKKAYVIIALVVENYVSNYIDNHNKNIVRF